LPVVLVGGGIKVKVTFADPVTGLPVVMLKIIKSVQFVSTSF